MNLISYIVLFTGLCCLMSCGSPKKESEKLLSASREAPIGGIWLTLYDQYEYELSYSPRRVDHSGMYSINADTIVLYRTDQKKVDTIKLVIENDRLIELSETGIGVLEVYRNKFD